MKKRFNNALLLLAVPLLFTNCQPQEEAAQPALNYGTDLFYLDESRTDYVVHPGKQPGALKGLFTAEPEGLQIDNRTGAVDINGSSTGHNYTINFISADNKTTLQTSLLVSGIYYLPEIYSLSQGKHTAKPLYNFSVGQPIPTGSAFDLPGKTATALAKDQGLEVNTATGELNLKKLIEGGQLKSGEYKEFNIHYRLNDQSRKALNNINFRVYYFDKNTPIPQNLLDEVESHRKYKKGRVGKFLGHVPTDII